MAATAWPGRVKVIIAAVLLSSGVLLIGTASAPRAVARAAKGADTNSINSLKMIGPKVGWALTNVGVARTIDGGRQWRPVGPRTYTLSLSHCNNDNGSEALFALSGSSAWIVFHCDGSTGSSNRLRIWHTTTRGATWKTSRLRDNGFVQAHSLFLDFVSPDVGWLATESADGTPPRVERLFRSVDAGTHWQYVAAEGGQLSNLLGFSSGATGFGYGPTTDGPWGLYYSDFKHFPSVTQDGGRVWFHAEAPKPPGFGTALLTVGTPGFSGPDSAAVPVSGWVGSSPEAPSHTFCATYHTRDGGRHWRYETPLAQVCPAEYLNKSVGWATPASGSKHGSLYRTTDGGRRWTLLGHSIWDVPGQFTFVTPKFGFIVPGDRSIIVTHDSGATWHRLTPRFLS